jgi:hypothetical protein
VRQDPEARRPELDCKSLSFRLAQERRKYIAIEPSSSKADYTKDSTPPPQQYVLSQPTDVVPTEVKVPDPQPATLEQQGRILVVDDNLINLKVSPNNAALPDDSETDNISLDYGCLLVEA